LHRLQAVIQLTDRFPRPDERGDDRGGDRARARPRDALEPVSGRVECEDRTSETDALDPAALKYQVGWLVPAARPRRHR